MQTYAPNGTPKPAASDSPYYPDRALVDAVNAALILQKPLLITGEPGCGKTQLAYSIAADLGMAPPLRFDAKSTSEATHLFYHYDAIGHFRAAQIRGENGDGSPLPHLQVKALGKAIFRTNPSTPETLRLMRETGPWEPSSSVVLIDEIDKAPRDFPNDLLNELESYCFRIPELGDQAEFGIPLGRKDLRPIIVITSNSERNLPEAFLRRCIYHDLKFPKAPVKEGERDLLQDIIFAHIRGDTSAFWVAELLSFFRYVRHTWGGRLQKMPGTAELLDLANLLSIRDIKCGLKSDVNQALLVSVLGVVLKTRDDHSYGERIVADWVKASS